MAGKLRIAVYHNLPTGGGKRALYNHVKALKEKGHFLEAWTTDLDNNFLPLSNLIKEHHIPLKTEFEKSYNIKSPIRKINRQREILKKHS